MYHRELVKNVKKSLQNRIVYRNIWEDGFDKQNFYVPRCRAVDCSRFRTPIEFQWIKYEKTGYSRRTCCFDPDSQLLIRLVCSNYCHHHQPLKSLTMLYLILIRLKIPKDIRLLILKYCCTSVTRVCFEDGCENIIVDSGGYCKQHRYCRKEDCTCTRSLGAKKCKICMIRLNQVQIEADACIDCGNPTVHKQFYCRFDILCKTVGCKHIRKMCCDLCSSCIRRKMMKKAELTLF